MGSRRICSFVVGPADFITVLCCVGMKTKILEDGRT